MTGREEATATADSDASQGETSPFPASVGGARASFRQPAFGPNPVVSLRAVGSMYYSLVFIF